MKRITNNTQAEDVSFHRGPSLGALGIVSSPFSWRASW